MTRHGKPSVRESRVSGHGFLFFPFPSAEGAGLLSCGPSGALMFMAPIMGSELHGDRFAVGVGGFEELAGLEAEHVRRECSWGRIGFLY